MNACRALILFLEDIREQWRGESRLMQEV